MYDKAIFLFEEAWEGRKHKLGDKHPNALYIEKNSVRKYQIKKPEK